jgi:hypothetical protein
VDVQMDVRGRHGKAILAPADDAGPGAGRHAREPEWTEKRRSFTLRLR